MEILDQYTANAPSLQNTLNIFQGEWSSRLPGALQDTHAGEVPLFEDGRIHWAIEQLGGVQGKRVLELGPLEGGHTYMLEQLGAAAITAVEANSRAYLKCLLVKEALDLQRAHFIYGDCIQFLEGNSETYDLCVASGILYHMRDPAKLLSLLSRTCNQMMIWTHYYDAELLSQKPDIYKRFASGKAATFEGFQHTLYRQEYGTAIGWSGFCGGSSAFSRWMTRADILACCRHFGFAEIQVNFEQPDHPNGPCFAFVASKAALTGHSPQPVLAPDAALSRLSQVEYQQQIEQLRRQTQRLQATADHLEQSLSSAQSRIVAMETSKFWQLRKSWFAFKKTFRLPSNES
jgi:hypothetical protein